MDNSGLGFEAFRAFILPHMHSALYPGTDPYPQWSAPGVQKLQDLTANLHSWLDCLVHELAGAANDRCPVHNLPNEVLCAIFTMATSSAYLFDSALLDLGRVCRRWNSLILDTPRFWTNIRIETDRLTPYRARTANRFKWRLAQSRHAPVDLTIKLMNDVGAGALEEPLRENIHRMRSLELDVPGNVLTGEWSLALALPAPQISRLSLRAAPPQGQWLRLAPFLEHLLGNEASQLVDLSLTWIALPPLSWQPFRGLERFAYQAGLTQAVNALDLAMLVHACPELRRLFVKTTHGFTVPSQWPILPFRSSAHPDTSVGIVTSLGSMRDALTFLSHIPLRDPKHLFCTNSNDNQACLDWFLEAATGNATTALQLSDCLLDLDAFTMTAAAFNSAGGTRATDVEILSLLDLEPLFGRLEELTISEVLWPTGERPALPHLHLLALTLEHPDESRANGHDGTGIFLLPLAPDNAWHLPALRALHLAHTDPNAGVDNPDGPPWGAPLVVSAVDLALFLKWNLRTSSPPRLVLQNVHLFEQDDSAARRQLDGAVQQVAFEDGYLPRTSDCMELV